jgi:Flp pilus assembly CpaE family ATPase
MIKKTLEVLLIEDSPEYAQLVQRWLSSKGDVRFVLNWTDSLMAGLNRLAQGRMDVILLDLGLPDSDGLETFTTTRAHAPGVPIILLSSADSEPLALGMVREGAEDYLVKSSCSGDLLTKAIQYAVLRHGSRGGKPGAEASPDQTRILGVLGVKGGVGVTTVACTLAAELRRQTNQKTLLADLDLNAGLVGFLMNAESEFSLLDAVSNVHRLDHACWEPMVAHGAEDLDVMRSPGLLGVGELDPDEVRNVLTLIRAFYQWIVLDLGRLNKLSKSLLERVNDVILVTTTSIPALFEAKRVIGALLNAGLGADHLRLIVNQHAKSLEFPGSELSRLFAIPIYARLPGAGQELHDACTQRRLPVDNCAFRLQIAGLARKLAGLPEEKAKSRVSQFLSFADKRQATDGGASIAPVA